MQAGKRIGPVQTLLVGLSIYVGFVSGATTRGCPYVFGLDCCYDLGSARRPLC